MVIDTHKARKLNGITAQLSYERVGIRRWDLMIHFAIKIYYYQMFYENVLQIFRIDHDSQIENPTFNSAEYHAVPIATIVNKYVPTGIKQIFTKS